MEQALNRLNHAPFNSKFLASVIKGVFVYSAYAALIY